jgi:undecaprenyl pyrophosphate synthase
VYAGEGEVKLYWQNDRSQGHQEGLPRIRELNQFCISFDLNNTVGVAMYEELGKVPESTLSFVRHERSWCSSTNLLLCLSAL